MNESQRSTEYIFQGTMYFFRREKILCRYQFALQDAVEPALLQRALEAALSAAPYYRVQLVQEKRSFFWSRTRTPVLCIRAVHSVISRRKRTAIFSA